MKKLSQLLRLCCLCIVATGCVIEAPAPQDDNPDGVGCNLNPSLCNDTQQCQLVDPCGTCDTDNADIVCPAVCIEVYACVTQLSENQRCLPDLDQCGTGLSCQEDLDAPCQPSFCDGTICSADCAPVFTCRPKPIRPSCFSRQLMTVAPSLPGQWTMSSK